MHIGFILTKTPAEEGFNTFIKFLKIYTGSDEVSIFLIGNGVYSVIAKPSKSHTLLSIIQDSNRKISVYACLDDIKARGLSEDILAENVDSFVSYDELVIDIMENIDQVLSF
jgi:sulfur relay protein TusB/DsrH